MPAFRLDWFARLHTILLIYGVFGRSRARQRYSADMAFCVLVDVVLCGTPFVLNHYVPFARILT